MSLDSSYTMGMQFVCVKLGTKKTYRKTFK